MKIVILDRDGTINQDRDDFVKSADEWIALPGALDAMSRLCQAGFTLVIATNQSGLGRGIYSIDDLNAMHSKMHHELRQWGARVDAIFFCPHNPESDLIEESSCSCRKPLPGMFEQIGQRYGIPLKGVPTVGDALRDMQAGFAAGCATHLVRTGKSQHRVPDSLPPGTLIHADLMAFAQHLIASEYPDV